MTSFLELYEKINQRYEDSAPSVALVLNHEEICDLRDAGEITIGDFQTLENANRLAYDAYTRYPKEVK